MSQHTYYVRASVLRGFEQFLEKFSIPPDTVLTEFGINPLTELDYERDLSFESVALLMERAAIISEQPTFGLSYAKSYPVGGLGLLAFLFLNSSTTEDALLTIVRYAPLIRAPVKFSFETIDAGGELRWRPTDGTPKSLHQIYDFGAALLMIRIRQILPAEWQPINVQLMRPAPEDRSEYISVFGPHITFDAPYNAICLDNVSLAHAVPQATPELRAVLLRYGETEIAGLVPADDTIIEKTREAIYLLMGERRLCLEGVASHLNTSPRTLQAQLAERSTTFEEVLNAARRLKAEQLLKSEKSLTEIAYQLGFSELSAFTRASQRWFNRSPRAQRQFLRLQSVPVN